MTKHETPSDIRWLILDVDGVLTDGRVQLAADGSEIKVFSARDGLGIRLWLDSGRSAAFITGRAGPAILARAKELGVTHVLTGIGDKAAALRSLMNEHNISSGQIAAMGDDLPDLPMLRLAARSAAPADAASEVRMAADIITVAGGGDGAVREFIEQLLREAGEWERVTAVFLDPAAASPSRAAPPISG